MKKSVKVFDQPDPQNTPEKDLHQIESHLNFTTGEQPLGHVAFNQWLIQRMGYTQNSFSGNASVRFLRLHESNKKD